MILELQISWVRGLGGFLFCLSQVIYQKHKPPPPYDTWWLPPLSSLHMQARFPRLLQMHEEKARNHHRQITWTKLCQESGRGRTVSVEPLFNDRHCANGPLQNHTFSRSSFPSMPWDVARTEGMRRESAEQLKAQQKDRESEISFSSPPYYEGKPVSVWGHNLFLLWQNTHKMYHFSHFSLYDSVAFN